MMWQVFAVCRQSSPRQTCGAGGAAWRAGRAASRGWPGGQAGRGRRAPVHGWQAVRHDCVCRVPPAMHTTKARVCRVPRAKHTANIFFFSIYIFIQFAYCLTKFY